MTTLPKSILAAMPKTVTLLGRGKRRYPIFPGVWVDCLKEARREKKWAATVAHDRRWKARACTMSLEHLAHVLATSIIDLAKEDYRYLELRRHLGNPQVWDQPARARWVKLGGKIRRPRKSRKSTTA